MSATGATLSGSYSEATSVPSASGFKWGTVSGNLTEVASCSASGKNGQLSASITGLKANTTYYFRAFVTVSGTLGHSQESKSFYGDEYSFHTDAALPDHLSGYGMPDISGLDPSLRASGTLSDRDDSWYSYSTSGSKKQIAVHTYSQGAPGNEETVNYVILYDESKYAPLWTAHTMNSTLWKDNKVGRTTPDPWTTDPAISLTQQSGIDNASASGYSRGHFVASGYRQTTTAQNKQTFYYSNQAPQWQNSFNSGVWSSLEQAVSSNTPGGSTMLYVVVGVLYEGSVKTLPSGNLSVPVPSHFYTCLMRCTFSGSTITGASGIAYLFTNEAHPNPASYSDFATSIDEVESRAGFDFFSSIPSALQTAAESSTSPLW